MITFDNYAEKYKGIDFSKLPDVLQKGHDFVKRVTVSFSSRSAYDISPSIKKAVDQYFAKLNEFLATSKSKAVAPARKEEPKKENRSVVKNKKVGQREVKKSPHASAKKAAMRQEDVEWVERIPEELRFMKRYVNLDNKTKTYDQLLSFINSLQRAILEKRIRKTSAYAKQVEYMQKKLIEVYNERKGESVLVKIAAKTQTEFLNLISKEKIYNSVQFIKRFISLHGKTGIKEKAKKLYNSLNRAVDKGKVKKNDKYAIKLNEIWKLLGAFIKDENQTRLAMDKEELNGLMGLIEDCNCGGLDGIDVPEDVDSPNEDIENKKGSMTLMNSMDFANLKFNAIGMTGKWLSLMGDPAPGFSAMVFGKPKMGKSFLCIDFAGYLARNHGKVLYVAREEGLDATLQKKLNETHVKNENLFVSDDLPEDLSPYNFIFLDSVNKLGLSPAELDKLRKENPGKSFIFVFQTTKDGNFRGKNEFQHDVDIVIEVYEQGKASQYGRYNQGGEMDIFTEAA